MAALTLSNVSAQYGKARIVHDVSLGVDRSETVGLLGRNGVGKTTLLRSIMNLGPTVNGTIMFDDENVSSASTASRVRKGIALMPQGMRVFSGLSVRENYRVAASAASQAMPLGAILAIIPEIEPLLDRPAGRLSGGQQQLVSLMRSLAGNCRILLMDEPTEGLMPRMVERIAEVLNSLKARGIGVLLVEQNLRLAEAVCDRLYIMEKGMLEAHGSFSALRASGTIERLLGV